MKKVPQIAETLKPKAGFTLCAILFVLPVLFAGCNKNAESSSGVAAVPQSAAKNNANSPSMSVRVSSPDANSGETAVAGASDGSVFVSWVEHKKSKDGDIFIQHFAGDGKPLSEPTRVNPQPEQATSWRGDPPSITVGADNAIYVGWAAHVEVPEGSANDLYLSISRDGGRTFAAPAKINDDPQPGVHGMHSIAVDKNGHIFAAWLDERYLKKETAAPPTEAKLNQPESLMPKGYQYEKAQHQMPQGDGNQMNHQMPPGEGGGEMKHQHKKEPNREVYFSMSKDGGKTFSANKRLAGDVCPCCRTTLFAAPDNRVYVSWRQVLKDDFRHIAVASSNNGGESFAPSVIVSDDHWQIAGCPVSGAALSTDSDNRLTVAWFTGGDAGAPGLYSSESIDGGKTFSPRKLVSDSAVAGTPALLYDAADGYRIVYGGQNDNIFATAQSKTGDNKNLKETEGLFPSAALSGGQVFASYIKVEGDKRSIWLSNLSK